MRTEEMKKKIIFFTFSIDASFMLQSMMNRKPIHFLAPFDVAYRTFKSVKEEEKKKKEKHIYS